MIRYLRDFRLIPIVLFATVSLFALKTIGLIIDGHYTLDESRPADDEITGTIPGTPRDPSREAAGGGKPAAKSADKQSWAQQMFNYPDVTGAVGEEKKEDKPAAAPAKGKAATKVVEEPPADGPKGWKPIPLAQVATRLAIVYLMNRKPDRALATLRATRSADLTNDMRNQRLLLEARALSDLGRHDVALEVIADIPGHETMRLRADILWAGKRWRAAAEQIEAIYGDRWREFEPLADGERQDILRAAIGYVLGEDPISIERFRERYAGKMGEGPDHRAFDVITAPVERSGSEFSDIAHAIAAIDTLTAFLRDLRTRYPESRAAAAPLPSAPAAPPPQAAPAEGATPQDGKADPSPTGTTTPRRRDDPAAASPLPLNPATMPRPAKSRTAAR